MGTDKFRVIVVGCGPVGLVAAHALTKAGIDFVILERRQDFLEDVGSSIVMEPRSLRVLSQLGLFKQLQAIHTDFTNVALITLGRYRYRNTKALSLQKENHGVFSHIYHRAQLIRVLYDGLDAQSKPRIVTGKKVNNITCDETGVRVYCTDGTHYDGSIVIGADGANSQVRPLMRSLSLAAAPTADVNPDKPFLCEYRTMWCTLPLRPDFNPGQSIETHAVDQSVQLLMGHDRAWMFLYERLRSPTSDRTFYSQEDLAAFAERLGDLPVNEKLSVKDVFPGRYRAGMVNLEEGILKHWSWGRIVLAGDAAHKFMPNIGQGLNNGVQDVVVLTNELRALLTSKSQRDSDQEDKRKGSQTEKKALYQPSTEELSALFKRYQVTRTEDVTVAYKVSAQAARASAWANALYWFYDRWILPHLPWWIEKWMFTSRVGFKESHGHILSFVKSDECFTGKIPWVTPMPS